MFKRKSSLALAALVLTSATAGAGVFAAGQSGIAATRDRPAFDDHDQQD